jgi:uncharacterized membrane protein
MTWHNETNSTAKRVARIIIELIGVLLVVSFNGYMFYSYPREMFTIAGILIGASLWMLFLDWILADDREDGQP